MPRTPVCEAATVPTLEELAWPRHTARLELRPATDDDVVEIAAIRAEPGVSEWLSAGGTADEITQRFADPQRRAGAIAVCRGGVIIGDAMISLKDGWAQAEVVDDAKACQAELGWVLAPSATGQGLGTELVRELLRIAFAELGLRRVVAECFADNVPSWKLMERVGMRRETYSIADGLHRSGRWLDGCTYALLADEWGPE